MIAIIGDIHGDSSKLAEALNSLTGFNKLILVGDYVNKGPDSKGVIDLLVKEKRKRGDRLVALRGNHDEAFLSYIATGDLGNFAAMGGLATIASYVPKPKGSIFDSLVESLPEEHRDFLESTEFYYEDDNLLVSHCGVNPNDLGSRAFKDMVQFGHAEIFSGGWKIPKKLVVCGHYVQESGRPYLSDSLACIDTGCGGKKGGLLSVLSYPAMKVISY